MNRTLKSAFGLSMLALAAQVAAQVTFYEAEGFRGRAFTTNRQLQNFQAQGFNDRASSVIVERGNWEVCEDVRFQGRCVVLRPGNYDTLSRMGMNDRLSSVRPVGKRRNLAAEAPEPLPAPNYEYRQRPREKVMEVPVLSSRAVIGPPEQRCWVERQQVNQPREDRNVGGAIVGAILGGIIGHQVGGGTGKDIATVGGAVAGGAIGANVGRDSGGTVDRDLRRCENVPSAKPAYWDVTYEYRGVTHRVQMTDAPGPTIRVNRNGEPRQ